MQSVESPAIAVLYDQALDLTQDMLAAARTADWDRLVRIEIQRGRVLDQIRSAAEPAPPETDAPRRREVIEEIMALDQQIKLLTHDWMHELRDILDSATAQRLLNKTYDTEPSPGG